MSWAENEKLNEWIERAFENGKREEQERIINIIKENNHDTICTETGCHCFGLDELISLITGQPTQCECDPCDNPDCKCRGKRCSFCLGQDENR